MIAVDAATALRCLAEARDRARSPAGAWPGWDFDAHPVATVVEEGTLLWNHPAPPEGFQPWIRPEVHLGPPIVAANSWMEVGGRTTATARLEDEQDPARAARILLHEAFHLFQQKVRPGSGVPFDRTAFYPEGNAANNALARAENRALAAFLDGSLPAGDAVRDVQALRATRYACAEEDWAAYEDACEWCEGGAQLAEALAFGRGVREEMAAALRRHNVGGSGAAYARFYASGGALGLLLAELAQADWRSQWLGGTPLSAVAACVPPGDAQESLARWRVGDLLAEEAEATRRRRAEAEAVLAGMAPALVVDFAEARPFGRMFNTPRLQVVGGGRRIHWGLLRLEGPGWVFHVPEGPVLEDLAAQRLILRVPEGLALGEAAGWVDLPLLRAERAVMRQDGAGGWRIGVLGGEG